ncbi:MAG: hypothetical protein ACR2OC_01235 [Solirubrobacterales bacterium]
MSVANDAQAWAQTVRELGEKREVRYEPIGGLNPADAPPALCPGGSNRLTGELGREFWGATCDAEEREEGGLFKKAVLPGAVLAKAHMPDLARVVPIFNVESLEANAEDLVQRYGSRHRVEFESLDFNKRFLATVPSDHDPIALRELFGPAFLDWVTTIDRDIDFGVSERQIYFLWRLRERSAGELELAVDAGGELFRRVRREMEESGLQPYPAGPWHAGLEPFPPNPANPGA